MSRLTTRVDRLHQRRAIQVACRLHALPPRLGLVALLNVTPEALPSPEKFGGFGDFEAELPAAMRRELNRVSRWTPQEHEAHTVQWLLTSGGDDPAVQRLLAALVAYERVQGGQST